MLDMERPIRVRIYIYPQRQSLNRRTLLERRELDVEAKLNKALSITIGGDQA